MKRTIISLSAVVGLLSLTACGSMTLDDGGRYEGYRQSALDLAKEAHRTEQFRIAALAGLAAGADDRTRDRIVSELATRSNAQPVSSGLQAPTAPTHLGLEALRVLGPGAIGLIAQGIGAWSSNQADINATQRAVETNALIAGTIDQTITSNTALGMAGMGLAEQAVGKLPATITVHTPTPAAPAAVE